MFMKPSVFIVDEDESILRWCEAALHDGSYRCEVFTSGFDFLNSAWLKRAACILLDINCEAEERKLEGTGFPQEGSSFVDGGGNGSTTALPSGDDTIIEDFGSDIVNAPRPQRGLGVLAKILRSDGSMPVILLSGDGNGTLVREAFLGGAFDFLTKPLQKPEFQKSVGIAVTRKNRRRVMDEKHPVDMDVRGRLDMLTPREFEVLGEMLRGMSIKQLAARFEISIQTAAKHRARVLHKMRMENEVQLIHLLGRRWEQIYADIVI